MIELSNTTAQVLQPGQSLTFNSIVMKSGCSENFRGNSALVTLRARGGMYSITFNGNVTSATPGLMQLVIYLDGEPLIETTMKATISAANDFANVSASTLVRTNCDCCAHISVVNTGTELVTVDANSAFSVKRVA